MWIQQIRVLLKLPRGFPKIHKGESIARDQTYGAVVDVTMATDQCRHEHDHDDRPRRHRPYGRVALFYIIQIQREDSCSC